MFTTKDIKEFLKSDTSKENIVFDIKYNQTENAAINNLKLENRKGFRYCGNLESLINEKKLDFLYDIGANDDDLIKTIQQIIYKLITRVIKCYNYDHFLLQIRIVLTPYDFMVPRWHFDGTFFVNNPDSLTAKFITVLKGDGTLFFQNNKKAYDIYYKNLEKNRKKIRKIMLTNKLLIPNEIKDEIYFEIQEDIEKKNYPTIMKKLSICKTSQLKTQQGLIFKVKSFMHSEPKITEPRFFIAILPSSKENIDELKIRWKL